jgi:hypothetical protein
MADLRTFRMHTDFSQQSGMQKNVGDSLMFP